MDEPAAGRMHSFATPRTRAIVRTMPSQAVGGEVRSSHARSDCNAAITFGDGGNHARAEEGVTDVTTNTNNRGPTSEARPAQKRWVGWDEFQRLGPPNNVHADVAWSLFGPGRYALDVLPETRAFMRRHRLEGVKR